MKIAITGGHFSPAYSVIKKLINKETFVIGREYAFEGDKNPTLEYELCKKEGIRFIPLNAGRLQRTFTRHTLKSLARVPKGVVDAVKILNKERPDVLLTFGGYIGLTVSLAARILKIPVVLHEQTQKAGLSSLIISKFANCVCISFKSSEKYFKNKNIVLTGLPVREEIFKYSEMNIPKDKPIIYITGGSTGSHLINMNVFEIIDKLNLKYTVVHQVGKSKYNDYEKLLEVKKGLKNQKNYIPKEFFEPQEVGWLFNNANLVIARSGINTISELIAVNAVALLIPLPHGQSNEQFDNAVYFKNIGLGEYVEQKNLTADSLFNRASDIIENRKKYISGKPMDLNFIDAADKILEQVNIYGTGNKEGQNPAVDL